MRCTSDYTKEQIIVRSWSRTLLALALIAFGLWLAFVGAPIPASVPLIVGVLTLAFYSCDAIEVTVRMSK